MKKESDDLSIEEKLDGIDLSEKTEMGDFANQIHMQRPSGSNITDDEASAAFTCNIVFPVIGLSNRNPVSTFLELSKSRKGWATEKVVQGAGGIQNVRSGGSIGGWLKDRLFTPKS